MAGARIFYSQQVFLCSFSFKCVYNFFTLVFTRRHLLTVRQPFGHTFTSLNCCNLCWGNGFSGGCFNQLNLGLAHGQCRLISVQYAQSFIVVIVMLGQIWHMIWWLLNYIIEMCRICSTNDWFLGKWANLKALPSGGTESDHCSYFLQDKMQVSLSALPYIFTGYIFHTQQWMWFFFFPLLP